MKPDKIFTKREVAEMVHRPLGKMIHDDVLEHCVSRLMQESNYNFLKMVRKSTKLNFCLFSPDKYFVRYN